MSDRSPTNPMLVTHAFSNGTEGHATCPEVVR